MTEGLRRGLLAPARRTHVLDTLARNGTVRISTLTEELGVSALTLRRDLAQLEEEGLLVRVHGGAVAPGAPAGPGSPENGAAAGMPGPTPPEGATRPTGTIGVLLPSLDFYWPGAISGMQQQARRHGLRVQVRGASYQVQDERPLLERLLASPETTGLIVAPNTDARHADEVLNWLADCPLPVVLVEREAFVGADGWPLESVVTDHAGGAVIAARHLASLGHQKIGLILSRNSPTSRKILAGWESACRTLGVGPAQHFEQDFPERTSPEFPDVVSATLDRVLASGVTGLLVHSDPEAMALVDVALARGVSVPRDLSVVAYDDVTAALFTPALTAISPARGDLGVAAVDLLVRRMTQPERSLQRVVLWPSLTVRESTCPPPHST